MVLTILTTIANLIAGSFKDWQVRKQSEQQIILAQNEARRQIALATVKAELELGKVQIRATGRYFKYFTFFMWFGPFMISTVFPAYGVTVFNNLNQLPEWYVQSCMVIMFAIWGIQTSKETISVIFSGLGEFFNQRSRLKFHKKLFYQTLRSTSGNLSQAEVDLFEKALDRALNEQKEEKES